MGDSSDGALMVKKVNKKSALLMLMKRLLDGAPLMRKSFSDFTKSEIEYLSQGVMIVVYLQNTFNGSILTSEFFKIVIERADEDDYCMRLRYRVVYAYIVRCRCLYFCPSELDFNRLVTVVHRQSNAVSAYCDWHFQTNDRLLPVGANTHFEMLQRYCSDYKNVGTLRGRIVNMSRFYYFLKRLILFVQNLRRKECMLREE